MLQHKHRQSFLVLFDALTCATSSPELHTAETRPKVLQHSHHLLRQGAPLQLALVVLVVVWRASRRILHRSPLTARGRLCSIPPQSGRALPWLNHHNRRQGSSGRHPAIPTYSSLQRRIHRAVVGVSCRCWSGSCIRRGGWCSVRRGAGLGTGGLPLHRRLGT